MIIAIKDFLKDYARLKIEEKAIKARLEELNPIIRQAMSDEGVDKIPTNQGNFSIKKTKRWTYSSDVIALKESLDKRKSDEEKDGTATFVEVEQLEFRELKNEV